MFINKEIETKWNNTTKKHYESKGYKFTKIGDAFTVKVADLLPKSNIKVDVQCEFCKEVLNRTFSSVIASSSYEKHKIFLCKKCVPIQIKRDAEERLRDGNLKREDYLYWTFRENREKEFLLFIKNHGTIEFMSEKDSQLYHAIQKHGSMESIVKAVGLKWENVSNAMPINYYDDFERVKEDTLVFIEKHDRFPTRNEMIQDVGIHGKYIKDHGGMQNIREKVGYTKKTDLMDDSGYENGSVMEYIVAQYLIANGISYKRDRKPFEDTMNTCDFYIESIDGIKFYVEIWGYLLNDRGMTGTVYNKNRKKKEILYKNRNLNLISLNCDDYRRLNYEDVQLYIKEKFSDIQKQELKIFDMQKFLYPRKLSDEDILNLLLDIGKSKDSLPLQSDVSKANLDPVLEEVRKRYGTYFAFARAFGKTTMGGRMIWTEELMYEAMVDVVLVKKKQINAKTLREHGYFGMAMFLNQKSGSSSLLIPKLLFYREYLKKHDYIHPEEESLFRRIVNQKRRNAIKVTDEQMNLTKEVLAILDSNTNKIA